MFSIILLDTITSSCLIPRIGSIAVINVKCYSDFIFSTKPGFLNRDTFFLLKFTNLVCSKIFRG